MTRTLHPDVDRIGRRFRVVGMSTPVTIAHKSELVLRPVTEGERVAVVAADVVRCSSTIVALLAGGAAAVTVSEKNGRGVSLVDAKRIAARFNLPLVFAGELNGQPIPGGIVGNSPRDAAVARVAGTMVAFSSTNFGAAYSELIAWRSRFVAAGGNPTIAVATFANVSRVAAWLNAGEFDRIAIALGGFYDVVSYEDVLLGGDLIRQLRHGDGDLDDEARIMAATSAHVPDLPSRLRHLRSNWIGQALATFGMDADIPAVLTGQGIPDKTWRAMSSQLPFVVLSEECALITPDGVLPHRAHELQAVE